MKARTAMITLMLAGCGDDIDTGLDEDEPLSALTVDEKRMVCETLNEQIVNRYSAEETIARLCTLFGLRRATTEAECETMRDACIATYGELPDASEDCDADLSATFSDCDDVTVGEYEECLNARVRRADEVLDATVCAMVGHRDDIESLSEAPIDECESLADECPEVE